MKRISILIFSLFLVFQAYSQLYIPGGSSTGVTDNSPSTHLEYKASNLWNGTIRANGTGYTSFALYESDALRWALYNHSSLGNTLLFANAAGQDKLSLTQSGNLGLDNVNPEVKLDLGNSQAGGLQFRHDQSQNYRIRLSPYWNSSTDTRLDFNIERVANAGFTTVMSVGYGHNVGIGTTSPSYKLDVEGLGARIKNSETTYNAYTTFRVQGPDYAHGLEIDFFGNNNTDINFSYGGGPGSGAIMNVNPKPLMLGTNNQPRLFIEGNGNVAIGTNDAKGYKLAVAGKIITEEVVVKLATNWPDYVFESDYQMPPLTELEKFIHENGHLPEVPTATDVKENGLSVGEMNAILLKKVEELTIYLIEQQKEIEALKTDLNARKK